MSEWQPIVTAPNVAGVDILVWCPDDEDTGYIAHCEIAMVCRGGYIEPRDGSGPWPDGVEPTHWMPLPPSPSVHGDER
jgi:hypothetical protein